MSHQKLLYPLTKLIRVCLPSLAEIAQQILLQEFQLIFPKEAPAHTAYLLDSNVDYLTRLYVHNI